MYLKRVLGKSLQRRACTICAQDFPEIPGLWEPKGDRKINRLLVLSAAQCESAFPMSTAVMSQKRAYIDTVTGCAQAPNRLILGIPGLGAADTLFKPAVSDSHLGLKIISVRPDNPTLHSMPSLTGCIVLLDRDTGVPTCIMDGQFVTGRRTAAGSGAATDFLCKPYPKHLCVFGDGVQGREHIRAMLTVRPSIKQVSIFSLNVQTAEELARKFSAVLPHVVFEAVDLDATDRVIPSADIICTATFAEAPLFDGSLVKPATHINCIGSYRPDTREIDTTTLKRSAVFVDSDKAFECGDFSQPVESGEYDVSEIAGVLGEWLMRSLHEVNELGKELTLFNGVGLGTQDLYAAADIHRKAVELGIGDFL